MQHPALEPILIDYYKTLFTPDRDWDFHVHVCEALLNYSCIAYQDEIRTEIEKCLKVHLVNDLIPVLAFKLNDQELNERLTRHAKQVASSSCVSGIILSTALAGHRYRQAFKEMIIDKDMEATYSGFGNDHYTLMGMHVMGITIAEL